MDFMPTLTTAAGGIIVAVIAAWRGRRKDQVEETSVLVQTAMEMVKGLTDELDRLRADYQDAQQAWANERDKMQDSERVLLLRLAHLQNELDELKRDRRQ